MRYSTIFILFILSHLLSKVDGGRNFLIINSNSGESITYKLLQSGESLKLSSLPMSELKIYSRVVGDKKVDYSYQLTTKTGVSSVKRVAKPSGVSKTYEGETVSKYNLKRVQDGSKIDRVINSSNLPLLFRLIYKGSNNRFANNQFKNYQPKEIDKFTTLENGKDEFNYIALGGGESATFTLSGYSYMKLITRVDLEKESNDCNFTYNIYQNDQLVRTVDSRSSISGEMMIKGDKGSRVSRGSSELLIIDKDSSEITLENPYKNRKIYFRVYVSKDSKRGDRA
jgi:hypothetical protein